MTANLNSDLNLDHMKTCLRCNVRYDWRKSASSTLKMTYCSHLCERGDLGFTLEALLHAEPKTQPGAAEVDATEATPV